MERRMRVGREEFEVDSAHQRENDKHYGEGRGLIGGDPARRPDHVRWRPIPEEQPYFRLIDISEGKRSRLAGFLAGRPLEVEIGSGSGEFLLGRAAAHPKRHFLGFEVKRHLCRAIVRAVATEDLANLWISDDDARWALPQLDLDARIQVLHVLYPDPWWKKRQHAKRLFRRPFIAAVHRLLAPGGLLHVRTDVEGYAGLIDDLMGKHGGFGANDKALAASFDADPPTQREAFCRETGRPFWVMGFRRI